MCYKKKKDDRKSWQRNKDAVRQGGKQVGGDAGAEVQIKMERVREG